MAAGNPRGTYLTIAEALRTELTSEEPPPALPSEKALMTSYGAARTTVRRALKTLEAEGLIASQPGIGWQPAASVGDRRPLLERLIGQIRADGLMVGARLPSEADYCEAFNVSRTAIRSALAQLEGKGIVEAVPGKGRFLRALPPSDFSS